MLAINFQAAQAQAPMGNYDYYIMRQQIVNSAMARQAKQRAAGTRRRGAQQAGTPEINSVNKRSAAMTFRPISSSIVPEQLAATEVNNQLESRRAFYEDCLRENEQIISEISKWREKTGTKDVADAFSTLISNVYFVQRDRQITWQQLSKISDQLAETPSVKAKFAKMSDREKQQTYETFSILGEIIVRDYDSAKISDDKEAIKQTRQKANEISLNVLGVSADRIQITNEGLALLKSGVKHIDDDSQTTAFSRSAEVTTAPEYAYKYKVSESFVANQLKRFDQEAIKRGGKTNDVAWVNAVSFALLYEVYTNGQTKLNQQQFDWVLKEMEDNILSDLRFQASSNERKQRYYEQIAIESIMILNQYQKEGVSPTINAAVKEKLINIFAPRKFDEYVLTTTGFGKR